MVCNSCETSHNFLSHSHVIIWVLRRTGSIYGGGGGGGGGSADIPGGCTKGRVSPFLIDLQRLGSLHFCSVP